MRSTRVMVLAAATAIFVMGAPGPRAAAQGLAGVQANWKDLDTWSNVIENGTTAELGLGLQPAGSSGALVAFLGRLSLRSPRTPPSTIRVQVGAGPMANSTVIRRPTLVFIADPGTEKRLTFDLTPMLTVDDPTPGGNIQNGVASIPAADFVRLAESGALAGSMFGFDFTMRGDQIEAMHAFAERLHLVAPKPARRD